MTAAIFANLVHPVEISVGLRIEIKKMNFRIESQRDANKIAQGATLGRVEIIAQALKGRNNYKGFMSPLQGWHPFPKPTQGCTLGYHIPLRWS